MVEKAKKKDLIKPLSNFNAVLLEDFFGELQCDKCIHYIEADICTAFPDGGIPPEIMSGSFIHNKKHFEQRNVILFEEEKND